MKMGQHNFTIIELIVVIIIVAVLAVIAIPKFLDVKTEAELSAAEGVYGAVQGAVQIAYAGNRVRGNDLPSSIIDGYLEADHAEGWEGSGLEITRDSNGDGVVDYCIIVDNETLPPTVAKNW